MTRDYAKPKRRGKGNARRAPTSRGTAQGPGWLWLLAGVLIGALATTLVRLSDTPVPDNSPKDGHEAGAKPDKNRDTGPRFDFYTLLKETEVIVPEESEAARPTKPDQTEPEDTTETEQSTGGEVYILQAGSFKSADDADSLRARLLLLNMDASVQAVALRPGETWHRVLVGPFTSTSRLSDARTTLMQNGIDTIQLKRK